MICVGVVFPGTQPEAVTVLILAGSSLSAIALLSPVYREFEIGLTKLRFARGDSGTPEPWMVAEVETLVKIGRWALGDPDLARRIVEEAATMVRRVNRRLPREERELIKLRALVALLDKANQERAMDGGWRGGADLNETIEALQSVDFEARIAFALRSQYRIKVVAEILEVSPAEVSAQIERARRFVSSRVKIGEAAT
jgi:hypothetical protein